MTLVIPENHRTKNYDILYTAKVMTV